MEYTIIVVGCGATGSHLTSLLSQLAVSEKKIKEIVLIDGDIVEPKNFRNQKFTEKNVGRKKSEVLSTRYRKLKIDISYKDEYLVDPTTITELLKDSSNTPIIIGCVDNNKARRVLNSTFYSEKIPQLIYIDCGNGDGEHRDGQIVVGVKNKGKVIKPPVGDVYPTMMDERYDEKDEEVLYTCSRVEEHPQNFATNVFSGTLAFIILNNIICNNATDLPFYLSFFTDSLTVKEISLKK